MHCANVFSNTSNQNVLFLNIYGTWHLWLGSISFDAFLFHIFGMMISVSFDIFRKHVLWCFVVACLLLFGLERMASTLVVTPGGLHRTTACCFLTASFWRAWSTARLSVRLGSSCSFSDNCSSTRSTTYFVPYHLIFQCTVVTVFYEFMQRCYERVNRFASHLFTLVELCPLIDHIRLIHESAISRGCLVVGPIFGSGM